MEKTGNIRKYLAPIVILFSLIMPCCNTVEKQKPSQNFEKDIPARLKETFESTKSLRDTLKLDTIENGFDSLEVRIWMSFNYRQQLFVLKNVKGVWSASLINFGPVLDKYQDSVLYIKKEISSCKPKGSWEEFTSRLFGYHIMELPDESKLAKYDGGGDGSHFAFEVSTSKKYRIYTYSKPEVNQEIPEARNVLNILDLIRDEFDVRLLKGRDGE